MTARIGLVLSGGGTRAFAHLGLLQALDEWGIRLFAISGVSSGAIVGALYASGQRPDKILAITKKHSYFGISNFLFHKEGFFSMQPLLNSLQDLIPEDSFESLPIRLFVTATDLTRNKTVTFSRGKLFLPILGSCSVPVVFEPVRFGDGFLDVFTWQSQVRSMQKQAVAMCSWSPGLIHLACSTEKRRT